MNGRDDGAKRTIEESGTAWPRGTVVDGTPVPVAAHGESDDDEPPGRPSADLDGGHEPSWPPPG